MFLQRRPPSYLSACELQVEKCALILWKKTVFMLPSPRRWSLAAAAASLLPRPRSMDDGGGSRIYTRRQVTERRAACYRVQGGVFLIFIEFYRLIVKWERGVSEEAHRCAEAVEAASNFIMFSPFLWLRRWGGAAPLWLSGVTWQQVIQPRVMNDTPGEWESRRETNRFSCNSPGAHPRRPSPEFYTRVSSNRKKTPQRELKRTCGQTGVRLVFILSFLALCIEAASTSCVCDPFSLLGFLDPLPVSDERLGLFFCSFVSARLHLIRQHLINDYEQTDTQRHPLHTKLSFNVSTCALISVLMVIWGQRSEETGVKPGELALMVLHGPFL